MIESKNFETYLSISSNKFEIILYDKKNSKNLYEKNIKIEYQNNIINLDLLSEFLENNIFLIEKKIGEFVKNIYLIIDNYEVENVFIGIKKKNYEKILSKNFLEKTLIEAKDLFHENYQNYKIMHMIINKYYIDNKYISSFEENLTGNHLSAEIQFISVPKLKIEELNKVLEKYHIKISEYLDGDYLRNFFKSEKLELSEMGSRILKGINENEVNLIPKTYKKKGFFEKFFQLFS